MAILLQPRWYDTHFGKVIDYGKHMCFAPACFFQVEAKTKNIYSYYHLFKYVMALAKEKRLTLGF